MIDVSIILVNYKTADLCSDAIKSIVNKTKDITYEIIVVDNSEDDKQYKILSSLEGVQVLRPDENLGFGNANNLGASYAKGKYLFFLNTDTILINNAIKELVDFLNEHPDASIAGANLFNRELKPNISYELKEKNIFRERCLFGLLSKKINKNYFHNYKNHPIKINGYISGACLMIRHDIFDKLNGFDKNIFMYAEDSLICYRAINELKTKIYNVPSAKIIHFEGGSFALASEKRISMQTDGNVKYYLLAFGYKKTIRYIKKSIKYYKNKILFTKKSKKTILNKYYSNHLVIYKKRLEEMLKTI